MELHQVLDHNAKMRKQPKAQLAAIHLKKADNGGVVAEHRMTEYNGKEPVHAFGKDEGHLLAAHLQQHLGIQMPGKVSESEDEPEA